MKAIFLTLALFALQQSDCGEQPVTSSSGSFYVIRVCAEQPEDAEDIRQLIDYDNGWLTPTDVRFTLTSSPCDVTVEFGGIRIRDAAAVSFVWRGTVKLRRGFPNNYINLMHEILHCAGMPHEDDPTSVMYLYEGGPSELRQHHVEALRRLAGITPLGRIGRQIDSLR